MKGLKELRDAIKLAEREICEWRKFKKHCQEKIKALRKKV